ncbi:phosphoketolase family protein [Halotalea alkalilenta]|uniref:Probable phosphoketolase n=1 Tax=Halotalea alkalilenta TaxID=376489 RepID=A0A172YDK6_9GAMM|nr:phosphoketolase family protein [Halotalea alkalilenta]ANF57065.1 phosphoketolase [Halotalea alkalilenta]
MAVTRQPLDQEQLERLDAWWRAANYLTVGQIYLKDNPLLERPLELDDIKPRLLGHWGTSPGLNLIYVHANRLIKAYDLDALYLTGPGHGGPALLANVWLENSYTEHFPEVTRDRTGMRRLFRQFSTPGGIPSHVSVPTPGSIHEGGELGYVLTHAYGAVFDNPDLIAIAVVGDGEAETGPLEGSWKGNKFVNPTRDGAVLPILHLNGYKIAGPTVLGREDDERLTKYFEGHGYSPRFVEGDDPMAVHQQMAEVLEQAVVDILEIRQRARSEGFDTRPEWPMIVLRTPKGWTGPSEVDGKQVEGTFRSHQVPLSGLRDHPEHLRQLEEWLKSYRPEELFGQQGQPVAELLELAPEGNRRMGSNPHANGGTLREPLVLRDWRSYTLKIDDANRARERHESTRVLGGMLRDVYLDNPHSFRLFCPDETNSNRLGAVFEASDRCLVSTIYDYDDYVSHQGRVMEVLSEHNCHGWLEGYVLTGRHGIFATYEAFATIIDSMAIQHAKWLEHACDVPWRAPIPSLNYLLTSTCWRNDHNGFSHQGPGFIDSLISKRPEVVRIYLPPDANCLLSVADHCLNSVNYLNAIVIDKQPQMQYLNAEEASAHCAAGASIWAWAGNEVEGEEPDIVMACAGDIPTQETLAAIDLLLQHLPELKIRMVNVVDLMMLPPSDRHPHGASQEKFNALFTTSKPVLFTFHGYPGVVHQLLHGRASTERFHVRGYQEEGTTTTPFDMVVLNRISRIHLCLDVLRYVPDRLEKASAFIGYLENLLDEHQRYTREHFDDLPEITEWRWSGGKG